MEFPSLPQNDSRERAPYPLAQTQLHRMAVRVVRAAFGPIMILEVQGLENLPAGGGVVLAANHLTGFDMFPLQLGLPRTIFYMGKAELFQIPVVHWLFRNLCAFPVYRGERDGWAMGHAARILRAGQVLGIFPEGTRSRGVGLQPAKLGAARLAIETRCPVVPVAMDGSQRFFTRFPRRTHVSLRICAPVEPRQDEDPENLTQRIMFSLAANLPPELRGVYAAPPPLTDDW